VIGPTIIEILSERLQVDFFNGEFVEKLFKCAFFQIKQTIDVLNIFSYSLLILFTFRVAKFDKT